MHTFCNWTTDRKTFKNKNLKLIIIYLELYEVRYISTNNNYRFSYKYDKH